MPQNKYTALVLAAQRPGIVNPLAEHFGVSHKCLIKVNGSSMVDRVLTVLDQSDNVGHIALILEDYAIIENLPEVKRLQESGKLTYIKSEQTLSSSVLSAIRTLGTEKMPYMITTADNCFHTVDIIDYFMNEVRDKKAEAAWAMTPDLLVQETYPGTGKITGQHKLIDGVWSNCNIYAICTEAALSSVELFKGGGQFGNKKKRRAMLPMIGVWAFFLYRFGLITLNGLARKASSIFKIKAHAVKMPFADAPIDADDLVSFNFIEDHLIEREGSHRD
ncbi:NTP transferase domain-containing protein [Temperatibacter marinus]|uniref:NTP transferase domain-containing protein n=1 Tax=Temperatibacter marinus TaxID=1456591 RepID=A0AA52EDD9_9PROT|nr:NTP transferase domain-containing protein [Temperatibacter marinus]WND03407.1 NTP transferase domain-containing protein [Temperatibacter marinus]